MALRGWPGILPNCLPGAFDFGIAQSSSSLEWHVMGSDLSQAWTCDLRTWVSHWCDPYD